MQYISDKICLLIIYWIHFPISLILHCDQNQSAQNILYFRKLFSVNINILKLHFLTLILDACQFEKLHDVLVLSWTWSAFLVDWKHLSRLHFFKTSTSIYRFLEILSYRTFIMFAVSLRTNRKILCIFQRLIGALQTVKSNILFI
jgi:hypothetical protein